MEGKPVLTLSATIAVLITAVSLPASLALKTDADGLTPVDHALCAVFPGRVCLRVAELTKTEQRQLDYITRACAGGVTEECILTR